MTRSRSTNSTPAAGPPGASQIVAAFRFLEEELGFAVVQAASDPREIQVSFEADVASVSVAVDAAGTPFVWVTNRETRESYPLLFLVRDQCPDEEARLARTADLDEHLRVCADLLRRCGAGVLAGDFSCTPRLRKLRAEHTRESNRARFGTSTGETPRFDSRPTLAALFSDASNDGLREARAYQAVWDYDYPLEEIGTFLRVGVREVQAMLDRWDRL